MLIYFWLVFAFVIGAVVGSFLNVCIARLPLEKSLLWPSSRCGHCLQPIRWYDNLPLIGYLMLRGKCRDCHYPYSPRYLVVELLTALGFVGLFYLEVVVNIHEWPAPQNFLALQMQMGVYPWQWIAGFAFHAVLFSLLLVAAFCDLDYQRIPLGLTLFGAAIGLVGAVVFPWPWPWTAAEALQPVFNQQQLLNAPNLPWWQLPPGIGPKHGFYPWPVWGPLPDWLPPGSWQLGLATGLVGILVGSMFLRMVAYLFSRGLGKEALGLGDADLTMMAGAFLGWQPVIVAFFVSVFPGLLFGLFQVIFRKGGHFPFGPSLAMGILITMLGWRWIAPEVQLVFFWDVLLICLVVLAGGFMLFSSYLMRILRPAK